MNDCHTSHSSATRYGSSMRAALALATAMLTFALPLNGQGLESGNWLGAVLDPAGGRRRTPVPASQPVSDRRHAVVHVEDQPRANLPTLAPARQALPRR